MIVRVLLFGPEAHAAGMRVLEVEVEGDRVQAAHVLERIGTVCPALSPFLPACRLAVNHTFVTANATVRGEDEVALIGMVSGG